MAADTLRCARQPTHPPNHRVFLQFEGVDSCFYAWLNGTFVGFAKDSRLTAEFEVTDMIKAGPNTLAVQVRACHCCAVWA